ncbi:tryptophan--tRNA ligase [Erysipelothrix sp. HDW6C]|uniref:tryptophan--tRNA ligase n=1 Tax=Erysipelothrix sp. HDW6C TaxID=2714930 RepID=UPI00140866F1|nr:tryptophan--tRNA ligase [Erysipelothrix sp. HDW6C]QIK70910.1 tryptophan--tRNA ligase [Erysipelothrix sp. HDW6C]
MRKKMISGIKPTAQLTLGNYIGALRPFVLSQEEYDVNVFIANLHCITMPIDPEELETNLKDVLLFYLASGLDPKRSNIFLQSDIPEIAQLGFIMSCLTPMGELNRMTQFKDKKDTGMSLSGGFYTYPTLMTADIVIHQADLVPVGEDQKQHVELARNTAERFNNRFGETFVIPEPVIAKVGSKIMSLQDPTKKMSKSDKEGEKGVVYLKDDLKVARKKIMSAVTDSLGVVKYDVENQPGIANLLTIYAALKNISIKEAEAQFVDVQYGTFKKAVADVVCDELEMLHEGYDKFAQGGFVDDVLRQGADKMRPGAQAMLDKVQKAMGLDWK